MDLAILDDYLLAEDADAVTGAVADLAVAQRHAVGRDLDPVAAGPAAVHQVVLVHAGPGHLQAVDLLGGLEAADGAPGADRLRLLGERRRRWNAGPEREGHN